ncbi:hypothetical protein P3T76_002327 [Phytophthora citrophthora]|uniref:Ricin B lectin domain-containing protein n=1 Tax=Phytophthora citrophthora TaxID=4793 RepID=A0AAD9LR63_9STRA|nr:hypothetical protein P3T76_002327 [Phytophthora citrophthora]
MDLSEIPFNVPVILESHHKETSLKNPLGSKNARCLTRNRDYYEQLVLHRVRDDKVAIQSYHNGRFLQVRASGECVFDPKEPGEWELFTMETDSECALYFVSCHTGNVLQCDENAIVKCANQNRLHREAWRIVEPRNAVMANQAVERASNQSNVLSNKDRQNLVIELARCGKSPDEIQQIITNIFDAPAAAMSSSFAVPVVKE